jgi:hypothetical protein
MENLTFTFTLPHGANSKFIQVSGGADADRDGTIEDNTEVAAFSRNGNVWTRQQQVNSPTDGMLFAVTFTVGPSVAWSLVITNGAGKSLYQGANTTLIATETVSYRL